MASFQVARRGNFRPRSRFVLPLERGVKEGAMAPVTFVRQQRRLLVAAVAVFVEASYPSRAKRLALLLVPILALAGVVGAAPAGAVQQAFRTVGSGCCVLKGSRSTILAPRASEVSLPSGAFFDSAAEADDGSDLLQTGLTYEFNAPEGPSCTYGNGAPALYVFVEKIKDGNAQCYNRGLLAWESNHLYSVYTNTGTWVAALDGSVSSVTNTFDACSGNACQVTAFGEASSLFSGQWVAKFAGSGNTPWQRWTGTSWVTIQSSGIILNTGWTNSGPFPGGIWTFTYSH